MHKSIRNDLYRYTGKEDLKTLISTFWKSPGFRFTFFFRLSQLTTKRSIYRIILKIFYRRYFFRYGIQLPLSVKVGGGLMLPHFGGIVVNSKAKIGNNCNILQGVTIGNAKRGKLKGAPTIGNCVYIGPNALIIGNITIGDNVLIAGNSYVNFDVPSNSIVIGNPGNIISNENATKGYIENIVISAFVPR
ncbi:serine O-acetyltransferase [Larkinella insperata]|uniref:Serine acetyltransferase n=1 Tax=Larkinella insperata TaxID=332158 RepID=A0ABW3QBF0_9BACT|nr:serine acetyltransferase [Larkinella insperata]